MTCSSQPLMTKDNLDQLFLEMELGGTSENELAAKEATRVYCLGIIQIWEFTPEQLSAQANPYYQGYLDCLNKV